MNKLIKTTLKMTVVKILIMMIVLDGVAWGQTTFNRYYDRIFEIELQLFSSDPNLDYQSQSGGDVEKYFGYYKKDLLHFQERINTDHELTSLEKITLQIYTDSVIAQAVSLLARIEPSEEREKQYLNSRLKNLEYIQNNPEDNRKMLKESRIGGKREKVLLSEIKAIYADNLFNLAGIDPGGLYSYVKELEHEGHKAIRLNPKNIRALLTLGIYYITIGNLNPINLNKAQRFLDQTFSLLEQTGESQNFKLSSQQRQFYLAQAWTWQSQLNLTRLDRKTALVSINKALAIYPASSFLNYVKILINLNRLLTKGDGELFENPEGVNFYYEYSFASKERFLYKNYFNFVFDNHTLSPYLGIGNNFNPFAFYVETGLRWKWRTFLSQIIFRHKNSFSQKLPGYYSGVLTLGWADYGWNITLSSDIGQLWKYRFDQDKKGYFYKDVVGLEESLNIQYLIFNYPYVDLDANFQGKYFYSWDIGKGLWSGDSYLRMNTLKTGWGKLKIKSGIYLVGQNFQEGQLFNRLTFYSKSPSRLIKFTEGFEFPKTSLAGDWLGLSSLTYQLYPLYFLNTHSAVKSIFIAPSFFFGWIGDEIGKTNSQFSYSALGNIGFTFPGGTNISAGFGWNEKDDWVINILAY